MWSGTNKDWSKSKYVFLRGLGGTTKVMNKTFSSPEDYSLQ